VCKRFNALCLAPQLLRSVEAYIERAATALPRLCALYHLLAAAPRQSIERLVLELSWKAHNHVEDDEQREVLALVPMCLAACGGTQPALLELSAQGPLGSAAWLPHFTALQRLKLIAVDEPLRLPAGISRLTRLKEAELSCDLLELGPGAWLPSSLTLLTLRDDTSEQMPHQVRRRSRTPPTCMTWHVRLRGSCRTSPACRLKPAVQAQLASPLFALGRCFQPCSSVFLLCNLESLNNSPLMPAAC